MKPVLEYRNISKTYLKGQGAAVCGVDLSVQKGEVLSLVGESGSGKSTLLRIAAGLESPDAGGEVWINGRCVVGKGMWVRPEKRKVGMVFQDGALFPHMTVEENIAYGLPKGSRAQSRSHVDFILAMVRLSGLNRRYPHALSGGERQRLGLARALAPRPNIILLDEPFSSLDMCLRKSLANEIRNILKKINATAILVTHDSDDALLVGDRVAVFRAGKIEQMGSPSEVYHTPENAYCAKLFGPANLYSRSDGSNLWVRPEDMEVLDREKKGAILVDVELIHDAGSHLEVFVRPAFQEAKASKLSIKWQLHLPYGSKVKAGEKKWVQLQSSPRR